MWSIYSCYVGNYYCVDLCCGRSSQTGLRTPDAIAAARRSGALWLLTTTFHSHDLQVVEKRKPHIFIWALAHNSIFLVKRKSVNPFHPLTT
jgi:hypothetical protein